MDAGAGAGNNSAQRVAVLGGTGFIGVRLCESLLAAGRPVAVVSRSPERAAHGFQRLPWAAEPLQQQRLRTVGYDDLAKACDGAGAVINLAGEGIADKPWTASQKQKILQSRVASCKTLMQALSEASIMPKVLLQGSAVGYYGDTGDVPMDESGRAGAGFLAETAQAWEQATEAASAMGVRRVLVRTGVVLDTGGGALGKMLPAFKFFLGGPLGDGKQWFSWIHRDDEVGGMLHCLNHADVEGPVNFVSPNPVTNNEFCHTLASVLQRPCMLRAPAALLKLLFGDMAREMLLASQRIVPARLLASGYAFRHATLMDALQTSLQG